MLVNKFWIATIRNNTEITFSPKCHWHYCSYWWITKNRFYVLWCCVPPVLVVQINNFFSLLLFSAVNHKRGGMKLISKRIKYKLDSSSRMYFAFFYPKDIQNIFGKLSVFSKIWKWNKQLEEVKGGGHVLCVIIE